MDAKEYIRRGGYICQDCADKNGGEWPEGHVATWHESECGICGERKCIACTSDWNWPNIKGNLPLREI